MTDQKRYWLDRTENVTKLYRGLWAAGIVLVLAELFVYKHEDLAIAGWFGFYALFGFVACVILVVTAKTLRRVLKRPEDYYDER
jgi:hypothetical protein